MPSTQCEDIGDDPDDERLLAILVLTSPTHTTSDALDCAAGCSGL